MGKGGYNGGSTVINAGSGWVGRGSVTSQSGGPKKKQSAVNTKSKRKKKGPKVDFSVSKKGNGLTIREMVTKAEQRVLTIESDIVKAKQRLRTLERDLVRARLEVETARNLPRKTALGAALHDAQRANAIIKTPESEKKEPKKGRVSEAERVADRRARENFRSAPKDVAVEHRAAGRVVSERVVTRS